MSPVTPGLRRPELVVSEVERSLPLARIGGTPRRPNEPTVRRASVPHRNDARRRCRCARGVPSAAGPVRHHDEAVRLPRPDATPADFARPDQITFGSRKTTPTWRPREVGNGGNGVEVERAGSARSKRTNPRRATLGTECRQADDLRATLDKAKAVAARSDVASSGRVHLRGRTTGIRLSNPAIPTIINCCDRATQSAEEPDRGHRAPTQTARRPRRPGICRGRLWDVRQRAGPGRIEGGSRTKMSTG